jgi:hypothetical protein
MDGEQPTGPGEVGEQSAVGPDAPPANRQPPGGPEAAPAAPPADRSKRRERAAVDALRTLIRDRAMERFGARRDWSTPVRFSFGVRIAPADSWALAFDPPFDAQLERQLVDAEAAWGVFVPGSVYCFRCATASCEHAAPPAPGTVFRGYSSTGVPEWYEFSQALIEANDERVDQLFGKPPKTLCLVQTGHELRDRQLTSFGRASHSYAILGQVVAGMFPLPASAAGNRSGVVTAVTVQAVETRGARGQVQVKLNTVVGGVTQEQWVELQGSEWQHALVRAIGEARAGMESIEGRLRIAREAGRTGADLSAIFRDVPRLLHRFARTVEQGGRQQARRTRHAQERRGERPVHKALDDAREAADESLFFDEKTQGRIVCGPAGRTHVFSAEGRHVTTFLLPPDGKAFRVRTQRWRRLTADEVTAFRARLAEQVGK